MRYQAIGSTKLNASIIGLGAWVMGGGSVWGPNPDDRESIRAIQTALDAGINLIDTAPAYGFGRSEEVVGQAIRGRRDQVLVATKCGLWWDDERGSFFAQFDGRPVRRSLRPDTIRIEVDRSLRRLGTDCIDLYQTHWPSVPPDQTAIADTMACLMALRTEGKIRAIGVSNVSLEELKENCAHGEVASDQLRYSMLYRDPEKELLPYCARNEIATLTYMSLEQGLLTGKVGMDRVFHPDEFRSNAAWNPWFLLSNRKRVIDLLARWHDLTDQYDCTLAQLVIAWTAAQPGVTHVLAGGRTPQQVEENAKAANLKLSPADLERMRRDVEALGQPSLST
ncbi:MAG TPA: aldo/keto reductase [Candidatus Paceibacterota bacterium]|nr:aldo/keto reductase [Verrucomicrobiota bacterium]HRY49384.1 aldo/keto reductase [Candidatus Paceibacterota bacterium]